jgi:hypothetical protein
VLAMSVQAFGDRSLGSPSPWGRLKKACIRPAWL